MPFCLVLCLDRKPCFFACAFFVKTIRFFGSVFLPKILGREGGLDVWTIRWLRELFLLCQLVVKLGARAAMDIYGVHADELAHCVALDEIIVRKCSRVLRLNHGKNWAKSRNVSFHMERALISPLPSDDMAREPLVRDLCSPNSPGPTNFHASLLKSGPLWKSRPRFCTS